MVAAALVITCLSVALVVHKTPGERIVHYAADGILPVDVILPPGLRTVDISTLPSPPGASLPPAVKILSQPFRITSKKFEGLATIVATYKQDNLPPEADEQDIVILVFVQEVGIWIPTASVVNPARQTVEVRTNHFSDWIVAVTDPEVLRDAQETGDRLSRSSGGQAAALLGGKLDRLSCKPTNRLLAAKVKMSWNPTGVVRICEEELSASVYRLQYVNTTSLPLAVRLPPGFEEERQDRRFDPLMARILERSGHEQSALILPGSSLRLRFPASAVGAGTVLNGDTDWSLYLLAVMRKLASAALLDEETSNEQARRRIERSFAAPDVQDCVIDGADEFSGSGDLEASLQRMLDKCLKIIVAEVYGQLRANLGDAAFDTKVLVRWIGKRVNLILAIPDVFDLLRLEVAGVAAAAKKLSRSETSMSIQPERYMTYAESVRLQSANPESEPNAQLRCPRVTFERFPPAGMPNEPLCLDVIPLDLDGDGRQDRLITWRPRWDAEYVGLNTDQVGAVGYLADAKETYGILDSRDIEMLQLSPIGLFHYRARLHLGSDTKAQAMITTQAGASTNSHLLIAWTRDGQLSVVTRLNDGKQQSPATVFEGGPETGSAAFGCVRFNGQSLLVETVTSFEADKVTWDRRFSRYDDRSLQTVATETTSSTSSSTKGPTIGSNCSIADPTRRGPELRSLR